MKQREEHCTHLNQQWCDCDWCRLVRQEERERGGAMIYITLHHEQGSIMCTPRNAYRAIRRGSTQSPARIKTLVCMIVAGEASEAWINWCGYGHAGERITAEQIVG